MWTRVILLEDPYILMGLKHWNNIRSQDFISRALSGKRSVTEVKWRLVME